MLNNNFKTFSVNLNLIFNDTYFLLQKFNPMHYYFYKFFRIIYFYKKYIFLSLETSESNRLLRFSSCKNSVSFLLVIFGSISSDFYSALII